MTRRCIFSAAVIFLSAAVYCGAQNQGQTSELEGSWNLTGFTLGGKEFPKDKIKGSKMVVKGDKMTLINPQGKAFRKFTFKTDPSKMPKHIDITAVDGKFKGKTNPGIYRLKKGALTLCMPNKATTKRPEKFESPKDGQIVLMVLKKVKQ